MSNADFIPAGAKQSIAAPSISPRSVPVEEWELGELPEVSSISLPPPIAVSLASHEVAPPIGTFPIHPPLPGAIVGQGAKVQSFFPPPTKTSGAGSDTPKRRVTLISGSDIEEQSITWLWDGYLPSGKLTLLAGAGGTGKSTIAFSFASIITTAAAWPDGTQCQEQGNVLIWSSEDDPADTIKPRLMAMGANQQRYFVITSTSDERGGKLSFDPANDIVLLREAVAQIGGISLLIIDPIVSAVTGDMHKANDVRRSLQAIVDFAAECNCAVLGITHFAKGTAGKKSDERVIGSQAFAAFARMVLVAAKEEDSERRVFTRAKSNNSIDTGGFAYSIEPIAVGQGIVATRILWGEALEGSSRSILAVVECEETSDLSASGRAKQFLNQELQSGPVSARDLLERAKDQVNISEKTLRRAKDELGIIAKKSGFGTGWTWELPYDLAALGKQVTSKRFDHVPWPG